MSSSDVLNEIQSHIDNDKNIVVMESNNDMIEMVMQRVCMMNKILSDDMVADRLKVLLNGELKKIIKYMDRILDIE